MAQNFLSQIYANHGIRIDDAFQDSSGSPGIAGQVLSSAGTSVVWVDPNTLPAGAAESVEIQVKNTSGVLLTKGTPVYIKPSTNAIDRVEVAAADAGDSTKMPAVGLLAQDLNNQATGAATTGGILTNFTTDPIDGSTPASNDTVYVKVGGGLTLTKPTGATGLIQNIAKVGKVSGGNSGSLVVSSILRTNDVPNLPTGRIWVGDGNTIASTVVFIDETNGFFGINNTTPTAQLDVTGQVKFEDLKLDGELLDQFNSPGTNGMILQSLKLGPTNPQGINWVSAGQIVVTGIQENNNTAFIDVTATGTGAGYVTGPVTISAELSASGTPLATNFLSGDNTWKQIEIASGNTNTLTVAFTNKNVLTVQTPGVGAATLGLATGKQIYDYIAGLTVDDLSPPTADFDVNNNKILNLTTPTLADDAANKAYVDNVLAGSGALIYQGGYNASTNTPDLTSSPNSIMQGWTYAVTAAGDASGFWSPSLNIGDLVIANVDNPTSISEWTEVQANIDVATAGTSVTSVKGIAGFNEDDFTAVNGFVSVKDDTYVPYTGATTNVDLGANNLIVDTDTLYVDSANNQVGIGTTSPAEKLHITGSGRFEGNKLNVGYGQSNAENYIQIGENRTGNGYAYIDLIGDETYTDFALRIFRNNTGANASSSIYHRGTGDFALQATDAASIKFLTQSAERMRITSSGNVGIKGTGTKLGWERASDNSPNIVYLTKNEDLGVNGNAKLHGYDGIVFSTEGSETPKMTIDTNGNVGIGTTSLGAKLEISNSSGNSFKSSSTTTTGFNASAFYNDNSKGWAQYVYGSAYSGGTYLNVGANGAVQAAINTTGAITTVGAFDLLLGTNSTERMRIDSSGNVGFNETPENSNGTWRNFEVGGINIVSRFTGNNDGFFGTGYVFKTDNSEVYKNTEAVSRVFFNNDIIEFQQAASGTAGTAISWDTPLKIDSSGNVGIGTGSSPSAKLHVKTTNTTAEDVAHFGNNNITDGLAVTTNGNLDWGFNARNTRNLTFSTNQIERMRITNAGGVSFGTSGTAYGTAGQVLKSNGNAPPTWGSAGSSYTAGAGITLNTLEFDLDADLTTVTSIHNTGLKIGRGASDDYISFATDNQISSFIGNAEKMRLDSSFDLQVAGDVVAASTAFSDERLKDNIKPIENSLEAIKKLNGVTYDWKANGKSSVGVIAQNIQEVFPELVKEVQPIGEDEKRLTVNYDGLVGVLIEAVKDLSKQVEELKK